jgi:hypothetical protein
MIGVDGAADEALRVRAVSRRVSVFCPSGRAHRSVARQTTGRYYKEADLTKTCVLCGGKSAVDCAGRCATGQLRAS